MEKAQELKLRGETYRVGDEVVFYDENFGGRFVGEIVRFNVDQSGEIIYAWIRSVKYPEPQRYSTYDIIR